MQLVKEACLSPNTPLAHTAPDHEQQDGAEQHGGQHGKHHKEEVVERGLGSDRDETNDSLLVTQVHLEEGEGEEERLAVTLMRYLGESHAHTKHIETPTPTH